MERDVYLQLCRIQYGYPPRAHAYTIGSSNMAGFFSALFGCSLTLGAYSAMDAAFLNHLRPLQSLTADDMLLAVLSAIMDLASTFIG